MQFKNRFYVTNQCHNQCHIYKMQILFIRDETAVSFIEG